MHFIRIQVPPLLPDIYWKNCEFWESSYGLCNKKMVDFARKCADKTYPIIFESLLWILLFYLRIRIQHFVKIGAGSVQIRIQES